MRIRVNRLSKANQPVTDRSRLVSAMQRNVKLRTEIEALVAEIEKLRAQREATAHIIEAHKATLWLSVTQLEELLKEV